MLDTKKKILTMLEVRVMQLQRTVENWILPLMLDCRQ